MDGTTTEMAAAGTVRRGGLRICVLGAARAELLVGSGAPPERVELGGARPRRLLLALAVDAGQAVSADRLAERVWGAQLPADPRAALHTLVSRLRQALGAEVIATDGPGYRLAVGAQDEAGRATLDALTFQSLVRTAAAPELGPLPRIELLGAALDLWHGAAFDEVAGEDWARAEAERLEELRLGALERRFNALLAAGRHTDALPALAGAVEANPLRDRLVGQQMLALFRAGRQAEAARVFQAHRARLATDLGLEPGHELVELDRRIVAGDPSLALEAIAPPPATPESRALRGYQLGELLGEGAFPVVFRGTQPTLGRDVAVKVIRAELANRPEFIRRFEAEAHLVAAIEHPHVVPLYDYWREPDRAYLVFRYLRGGTLEARLTAGSPLPLDQVRTLAVQVGAALTAAHRAGVVHRDVKPANVFLDELGDFYLGDFGIALVGTELTDPTAALSAGSPAYAAPEQLRRERTGRRPTSTGWASRCTRR
ncbi:MAG: protein kinase domain-containing protein [Acidimicrobiales bacterium]